MAKGLLADAGGVAADGRLSRGAATHGGCVARGDGAALGCAAALAGSRPKISRNNGFFIRNSQNMNSHPEQYLAW